VSPRGTNGSFIYSEIPFDGNVTFSDQVSFTVRVDPLDVTATLSAPTITYGGKDTVSGRVTYQPSPGAAYKPLGDQAVQVSGSTPVGTTAVFTGVTNAAGDYSVSLSSDIYTIWSVEAGSGSCSSLLTPVSAGATMCVNLPTVLSAVKVSLNQDWGLSFSGCLSLERDVSGAGLWRASTIELQYADSKAGP
jgi:hypothetical protein